MRNKLFTLLALSVSGILGAASMARANSIEITSFSSVPISGGFDYQYTMTLTAGNSISATNVNGNSMFVFYDLNGLFGSNASFTAADWLIAVEPTSGTWANGISSIVSQGGTVSVPDSATLPNVRFQYTGAGFSASTATILGVAHITSTQAPVGFAKYAARWIDNASGQTQINSDTPSAPGTISGEGQGVPLPSAAWMGISAIGCMAMYTIRRRRRLASA